MNFKKKSKMTTVIAMFLATVICVCFATIGAYAVSFSKESSLPSDNKIDTAGYVNIDESKERKKAGSADVIALMLKVQEVNILSEVNGFYRISILDNGKTFEGYISKEYVDINASSD